jgi:hypothetical protein
MGADFSRVRLDPLLDYAGVELKQGGVLLDGDANELVAIIDRRLRALASDTLGRTTVSSTTPDAFKISVAGGSLQIAKGRLYVDGLLAENHGAKSADPTKHTFDDLLAESQLADPIDYAAQPYLPNPPGLPTAGHHLVYLDVWDREVTHLENPDLVETAVGVETTSRLQTVWQVRVHAPDVGDTVTCATHDADIPGWGAVIAPSSGVLTTETFEVAPVDDPCELPPTGGYRGLENQLYRVEIHDPGQPGAATFKWSRENASVGSRVATIVSATELELETLGRDDVLRFNSGDWVEIIDDVREFAQAGGEMRRITVDEATRRIHFTPALPAAMLPAGFPDSNLPRTRHLRVRRWDQKGRVFRTDPSGTPVEVQDLDAAGSTGVILIPAAPTTLLLENGVTVSFASTGTAGFRAGDHWVFAARTADASVEKLMRAPPRGIHHHFARLGIWDLAAGTVTDCRNHWPPSVTGQDCSCTACVTVASHASGQFTIQDAVNRVAQTGGTVCLGPGQYALREPVRLTNAMSVRIRGQGATTVIVSPLGAFALQNCFAVAVESLSILSLAGRSAVTVRTAIGLSLRQLVIATVGGVNGAGAAAISLQGVVAAARISENAILAPIAVMANDPRAAAPVGDGTPVAYLLTAALAIEDNILWCQSQAVTLAGTVLHLMATRITGNEMLGCGDWGISVLGLGAPGSSMTIAGNSLGITGSGIRSGAPGARIEGNKLANSAVAADGPGNTAAGIALATGFDKNGIDDCQIMTNQISGFGRAGIVIGAPTQELMIKHNIIEACGNGIISADDANTAAASIENNQLRNIGPAGAARGTTVLGIGLTRAAASLIGGNTIRALGVRAAQSALRAAILAYGVAQPRVLGNTTSDIAPGEFIGTAAGVMLRAPFAEFTVSHNHVERDAVPSNQPSNESWLALDAEEFGFQSENPVSRLGDFVAVRIDNAQLLVLGAARPYVSAFGDIAGAAPAPVRGSVLGNVFTSRGRTPAVRVAAAGECLFNDNRVDAQLDGEQAVFLATTVAIVSGNRVRGPRKVSIALVGTRSAAVLGNITSGPIEVPDGLPAPWNALNLLA